jgi:hypothetical protein
MAKESRQEASERRSEAGRKAWRTMRRNGTVPSRRSPEKISLRPGSDGHLMAARLLKKGICPCAIAAATGQPRRAVLAIIR